VEFSQIFKAPSIPKIGRGTFSSSIFRGAAKLNSPIKLNRTRFSFAGAADPISAASIAPTTDALFETNRILVEIQKQLAYDFANRIAQEEEQIKLFKKEKEKKERISKEKSIEGIGKVGKTITGIFGFVTKPIKSIFDKIKEFFSIILTGIVLNNVFNWLEDPKNRKKVGDVFGFLVENWKIFASILVGGLALRALYKIIRLVRAVKGILRFLRILPQKPKGSPGVGQEATRGGLFRSAAGGRRGISTEAGTLRGPDRYSPYYKSGTGPVQQYQRSKTPLGKTLQSVEVLTAKAGSDILKKIGLGPGAKGILGFLRPIFKRIPVFGALMDFALSLALGEPIGRAAAKAIGAGLGGALGTLVPIPGVGTVAGGILGDLAGGAIYDAIVGKGKKETNDETPKYALGGKIKGPSHAVGGVPLLAEGGEFIVKKSEVSRYEPLLQDINENGGRLWDEFIAGVKRQKSINDMSFATVTEFEELLSKYKEIVKADEERLKRKQNEKPKGTGGPTNPNTRINTSNVSNLVGKAGIQQPSSIAPSASSYNVSMSQPNVSVQNISPRISVVPFSTRDLKPVKSGTNVVTLPPVYMNAGADASNLKLPSYNTGQQEYPSIVPYDISNEYLNKATFEYDIEGLSFGS
jgi:hypothetical protein